MIYRGYLIPSRESAFKVIQPDAGTPPVATSPNDTLTMTSSDGSVVITGNSGTDTIDFSSTASSVSALALDGSTVMTGAIETNPGTFISNVANSASAVGFEFKTANAFTTNGSKVASFLSGATEIAYAGRQNGANGFWSNRMAIGSSSSLSSDSVLSIVGSRDISISLPKGIGVVDIEATINAAGAIGAGAAFAGRAKATGNGVLPFVSGMLFEVDQQSTGSWGANPGIWTQEPVVIGARYTSSAGSTTMGNFLSCIKSFGPTFDAAGGFPSGIYNAFSAGSYDGTTLGTPNVYGLHISSQQGTTEGAGIFIATGSSHAAIICNDDNLGGRILFGAGKDASIYYDGTDLVANPNLVGSGSFKINGNLKTTNGVIRKFTTQTAAALTLTSAHHIILCDSSSNAITITLPAAASNSGREYTIKAIDNTNTITVDANASETIDGNLTMTLGAKASMKIISDGNNWWIV